MDNYLTCRMMLDSYMNGLIVTDSKGIIKLINLKARSIFDIKDLNHIGKYIVDYFPKVGLLVMDCLSKNKSEIGIAISENNINMIVKIDFIFYKETMIGTLCSIQKKDEYEKVAKKIALRQKLNNQFDNIFSASSDGIWVCDASGKVINVNSASIRLNGIEDFDVIGKKICELLRVGLFNKSVTLKVFETKQKVSVMQYITKTDKHLLCTGTPVFDEDGRISLVVVNERDMTELNCVREQLEKNKMITKKMKDELAELNLLEVNKQKIVAESQEMRQVLKCALKIARLDVSNILILGESGVGKGLVSKFIHKNSKRGKRPFVQINCAALPESLLEAELFGYEGGAFTGACEYGKAGLIELANKGTLFLDEIGDMPLSLQAKLLKYLDDNEIIRLGGTSLKKINCTIIAATNKDLKEEVKKQRFRYDLYYRLNTFTLVIPPLRKRPEDIFELVNSYMKNYNKIYKVNKKIFARGLEVIQNYSFPGNVRELKGLIKKAVVMCDEECIDNFIRESILMAPEPSFKYIDKYHPKLSLKDQLESLEKDILKDFINHGRTTRDIASELKISQTSVVRKLKKYGFSGSRWTENGSKISKLNNNKWLNVNRKRIS